MMNHIMQMVLVALCGRQEKSHAADRIQIEPLRRFVMVVLLAISVSGAFLTTPGQVQAAQGYYEPLTSRLYLWGADLTEQTLIPDTVVGALTELNTGVNTLAYVLANNLFRFPGDKYVREVVIAKADISGYPIAADLSGTTLAAGVLTIGNGTPSSNLTINRYTLFQNDGTVNITAWSVLRDESLLYSGSLTNTGTININALGTLSHTYSAEFRIGGTVNLSGWWDQGTNGIVRLDGSTNFLVQGGTFKSLVVIDQDINMTGAKFNEGLVNQRSLTLNNNNGFLKFLNNSGSVKLDNGNSAFLADTDNRGSFTANGSTITMTGSNILSTGAAIVNSGSFTVDNGSTITVNSAIAQNAVANNGPFIVAHGSSVTANGVTANEGTITVDNGSTIKFNDLVTGRGTINLASGANMTVGKVIQHVDTLSVGAE